MWQVLIRINYRVDMKNPRYLFWLLAILYTNYLFAGFLPNELVHVGVGKLELHNMKIGDQIISYNGIEPATDFVTKINAKTCQTSIKIYLGDIILIVSPDQFFYLPVQQTWISAQDLQIKQQKTMADIQAEQARLELDKMRIESQERIAGAQLGADTVMANKELEAKQLIEGTKIGIQAVQGNKQRNQQPKE